MATQVQILRWCDIHLQEKDERVRADEYTVTMVMDGGRPQTMTLDVCPDCVGPLLTVQELLATYGRKAQPAQAGSASKRGGSAGNTGGAATKGQDKQAQLAVAVPGGTVCVECGFEAANRKALGSHCRNVHGKLLAEVEGQADESTLTCLVCDPPQRLASRRALAIHVGRHNAAT